MSEMSEKPDVLRLRVLLSLMKEDSETCTVTGIAKTLGEEKYTVSRILTGLEKEGLLDRSDTRHPTLTEEGRKAAQVYGEKIKITMNHLIYEGVDVENAKSVLPEGYDAQNLVMYRINDDGTKTLIKGGVEDGYYKIATKHFSYYALVEKGSTITDAENTAQIEANKNTLVVGSGVNNVNGQTANVSAGNNTKVTSPKTGENIAIEYVEVITLLAAMILILAAAKKWKKTLLIKSHQ